MDALERMMIEHECRWLVASYCHHVDHGNAHGVADLFTEDGIWGSGEMELKGREALVRGFSKLDADGDRMSRHVCHDTLCGVIDRDVVEAITCVTLYNHTPDPDGNPSAIAALVMVGEYRDRFERTSKGWRISRREVGVRFPS